MSCPIMISQWTSLEMSFTHCNINGSCNKKSSIHCVKPTKNSAQNGIFTGDLDMNSVPLATSPKPLSIQISFRLLRVPVYFNVL